MKQILLSLFLQLAFTVGVVVLFGLLISLFHNFISRMAGRRAHKVYVITGIVGTPVHELSHAAMCVLFRHRISKIKLYQPKSMDGTLGYVNHSYNRKNIYQQIGNFFIGVAPILVGSAVLLLLLHLMVPHTFADVMQNITGTAAKMTGTGLSAISDYIELFFALIAAIFSFSNMQNGLWWLFLVLAVMISMHMKLSVSDVKGGFQGFLALAAVLLALDAILWIVAPSALEKLTSGAIALSAGVVSFLLISVVFSLVAVGISFIIGMIAGLKKSH